MARKALYKLCPQCSTRKPRSEFWKDRSKNDGLWFMCRTCARDYRRKLLGRPPVDGEVHARCGGELVLYRKGYHRGFDPDLVRCERCGLGGVPV